MRYTICMFSLFLTSVSAKTDTIAELYKITLSVKECLMNKYPGVCLKERALESLNESIYIDDPIRIGFISIERNSDYNWNSSVGEILPTEISRRSIELNDALYDKMMEFFKSRTIRFNINEAVEGRKKGGGGGGGGGGKGKGMMMAGGAVVCVVAGMMMGKMGMMAMGAMMMSKMALLMSAIMALKKMKGGGGGDEGKEKQIKIIYATSDDGGGYGKGGGGGGGGGWHRSLNQEPHTITYRAHVPQENNANVVYEGTVKCEKEQVNPEESPKP